MLIPTSDRRHDSANGVSTFGAVSRRHFLVAAAATAASGCAVSPTIANLADVAGLVVRGAPDAPVTPEYVANLPYATLTAKIGRGQRALLVLAAYDGPDLRWAATNNAALVTRSGRLVKTAGLDRDLRGTHGIEDDPIAAATFAFAGVHQREVDIGPRGPYGVPIDSTFEVRGRETIRILDTDHDTLVVQESNRARSIRWNFDNHFWLDFTTGYAWKSVQNFEPHSPPVEIQITKPALPAPV